MVYLVCRRGRLATMVLAALVAQAKELPGKFLHD